MLEMISHEMPARAFLSGVLNARKLMKTLKQEIIDAISKLPENADIDEIMYRLFVIDKIRKAREAAAQGESLSIDQLQQEIESW